MSRDELSWTRSSGERVPIDKLKLDELRAARMELMHRDLGDPSTLALFDAVNDAIERYGVAEAPGAGAWRKAA
ncbi:MAG: hypothetical protein ACHQ52_10155 [Candidatus Eisenbacteria bacterium]